MKLLVIPFIALFLLADKVSCATSTDLSLEKNATLAGVVDEDVHIPPQEIKTLLDLEYAVIKLESSREGTKDQAFSSASMLAMGVGGLVIIIAFIALRRRQTKEFSSDLSWATSTSTHLLDEEIELILSLLSSMLSKNSIIGVFHCFFFIGERPNSNVG